LPIARTSTAAAAIAFFLLIWVLYLLGFVALWALFLDIFRDIAALFKAFVSHFSWRCLKGDVIVNGPLD
jgi:hypothetical protein